MPEITRKRLATSFVTGLVTISGFSLAAYFVAAGGGIDKSKAAIFATAIFVISIAALTWGAYNYYRDPNYKPKLNLRFFSWIALVVVVIAFVQLFHFATGVLITISAGILGAAGVPVSKTVIVALSWISLVVGIVLAVQFVRMAWKKFNGASA